MLLTSEEFRKFSKYMENEAENSFSPGLLEFRLKIAIGGGIDLRVFNTETNLEVDLRHGQITNNEK